MPISRARSGKPISRHCPGRFIVRISFARYCEPRVRPRMAESQSQPPKQLNLSPRNAFNGERAAKPTENRCVGLKFEKHFNSFWWQFIFSDVHSNVLDGAVLRKVNSMYSVATRNDQSECVIS